VIGARGKRSGAANFIRNGAIERRNAQEMISP